MGFKTSWDGHYMYPAFIGFVRFAASEPEMLKQYEAETGRLVYSPPKSAIDKMADEACGTDRAFVQSFSDWCETQFGTPANIFNVSEGA